MTFLRVDNRYLNLDNVTEIIDHNEEGITVHFAVSGGSGETRFEGEQAAALRDWLQHHATFTAWPPPDRPSAETQPSDPAWR